MLSGREHADLPRLILLIHQINPTGRGRDPDTEARHYRLKAALQSLLIARFGAELEVEETAPDTVVLRRRLDGRDAAHARVDELDEEARLWVRRHLDPVVEVPASRPATATTPHPEPASSPPGDLYEQGRAAHAEWDHDRATACWRACLRARPDHLGAARALAAIWVDELAQGELLVALSGELPQSTLADREVASALALALARSGQAERAWRTRPPAETDPRAPETLTALARRALEGRDLAEARRAIDLLAEVEPGWRDLPRLQARLGEARRAARAPWHARIDAALAEQDWGTLQQVLEEVSSRWPSDEVAASARARLERHQAARHKDRLREQARASEDRGELDLALARWRRLRALGEPGAEREERRLAEALRVATERRRLSGLRERIAAGGPGAWRTWMELDGPEREALAELVPASLRPLCEQVRAQLPRRSWARAAKALPDLLEAEAHLDRSDWRAAQATLEDLSVLGPLLRAPRTRLDALRADLAEACLARAAGRLEAGDLDAALTALGRIPGPLTGDLAKREASLQAVLLEASRAHSFETLLATDRALEAWRLARGLVHRGEPWRSRVEQARQAVERAWGLEVAPPGTGEVTVAAHRLLQHGAGYEAQVDADHGLLYLLDTYGELLVVRAVSLAGGVVDDVLSLRLPEAIGLATCRVHAGTLWVLGRSGVLHLGLHPWRLLDYQTFGDDTCADAHMGPDGRMLWRGQEDDTWTVHDTCGWRVIRKLSGVASCVPIAHERRPLMALLHGGDRGLSFVSALGSRTRLPSWDRLNHPRSIAAGPIPGTAICLGVSSDEVDPPRYGPLEVLGWEHGAREGPVLHIPASDRAASAQVTASRETGLAYGLMGCSDQGRLLVAWTGGATTLHEQWRLRVPPMCLLVHDDRSRVVGLAGAGLEGWWWQQLGREPPEVPEVGWLCTTPLPPMDAPFGTWRDVVFQQRIQRRLRQLGDSPLERLRDWIAAPKRTREELAEGAMVLSALECSEEAEALARRLHEEGGRAPGQALLVLAHEVANRRDWEGVRRLLSQDPAELAIADWGVHLALLGAIAAAWTGGLERAVSLLGAAGSLLDHERLQELSGMMGTLLGGHPGQAGSEPERRGRHRVECLWSAHRCLQEGDGRGALAHLCDPESYVVDCLTIHTMRATAWLDLEPRGPGERLRRRLDLHLFLDALERRPAELPVACGAWQVDRHPELPDRVRRVVVSA